MERIIGMLAAVVCLLAFAGADPVRAEPVPDEQSATLAEYRRLSHEAEVAQEAAESARQRVITLRARSREAAADAEEARRQAASAVTAAQNARRRADSAFASERVGQHRVDAFARAALEGGVRFDGLAVLLNSDSPGELMSARSLLELIAGEHAGVLSALARTGRRARQAAAEAEEHRARAEDARRTAERGYRSVRSLADEATAALSAARQRERRLREKITDVRAALVELPTVERARLTGTGPVVTGPLPDDASGHAVRFALAQVGKPYSWGAAGPETYDCSGLVLAAYAAAGVALPRTSAAQSAVGTAVSRQEVRAGDLVFYYQPVSHVAIAVDHDRAAHASTVGEPVKVTSIDAIGPVTAIRRAGG